MWMRYDRNKENTTGRPNESSGLLPCPMCKGRGYFEPTQATSNVKNSECFPEQPDKCNSLKLPSLQASSGKKCRPTVRNRYTLPSINNVKNLPENRTSDASEPYKEPSSDMTKTRGLREKRRNYDEMVNPSSHKPESRIMSGMSQRLSLASSNESIGDRCLMPSPRTPTNPAETLKNSLLILKTNKWHESVNALKEIVQLSRFQPNLLEPSMVVVYRSLIFLLKSFRSTVVRTACQASNELFATMVNTQRPEFDELVSSLLQKTADTNKVVRQDANEALDTMVINIPPSHSVRPIMHKGILHKSPLVRTASARLLVCLVGVVGVENIFNGNRETRGKLINAAATFMQDGCQEVRNFGKRLMKMFMEHEDFDEVLQTEVNEIILKRIEKTLITMRYKT